MLVVHTSGRDPAFQRWNGADNFPAVLMNEEPVRTGWAEIIALAERLAPARALLPPDAEQRIRCLGLCHELLAEGGLAWCARLLAIDAGLAPAGRDGFPLPVAQYLAPRYGWMPGCAAGARSRAAQVLAQLDREIARSGGLTSLAANPARWTFVRRPSSTRPCRYRKRTVRCRHRSAAPLPTWDAHSGTR